MTVFQNAQSSPLHMPLIRSDSTFTGADVICLAETRLQDSDLDNDYSIEGFLPVIRNYQDKTHDRRPSHGLAIYVKQGHRIISSRKISTKLFESLCVDVVNSKSNCLYSVVVVYKAPACSFQDFKKHILSLSEQQFSNKLIIIGDFNFNVNADQSRNFLQVMNSRFPNAKYLRTSSTTKECTVLDVAFTTCNNANSEIITCV